MYIYSELTGKVYKIIENNYIEIIQDDRFQDWNDLQDWINLGNEILFVESTPEEIAEQKHYKIEEIKKFQYQELLSTDWYYTKLLETGQEVPLEIIQQRQQIREKYENLIKSY